VEAVRAALARLFREFIVSPPDEAGSASLTPKWGAERAKGGSLEVADFDAEGEPVFELTPGKVALEITDAAVFTR
jgi:hypothetical protein